jgi:electron transfer flavoprotein alpha subunit
MGINVKEAKGVYVFCEQMDGVVNGAAYELLGKAKELAADRGSEVTALLLGSNVKSQIPHLAKFGADKVLVVDDPALEKYMTEPYTAAIFKIIQDKKPEIVLFSATPIGRDLAPRVAGRVHTGLTADCTGLAIDKDGDPKKNYAPGDLLMTRPAFGGNLMATIRCHDFRPQMATVRPGVMQRVPSPKDNPDVVKNAEFFKVPDLKKSMNVEILDMVKKVSERMDILDAKVLCSGGRGMGGPEHFTLLETLAAEFKDATISCSRAVVDAGWMPKDRQVGQTGKTVRPKLYIACGISGAIQHLAGMDQSDVIIAVNKDATAPIFKVADYGLVGDALKVIPALTDAIRKYKKDKVVA